MKGFRLAEPHLSMLASLAEIYGSEAAVIRIAVERMYRETQNILRPNGSAEELPIVGDE